MNRNPALVQPVGASRIMPRLIGMLMAGPIHLDRQPRRLAIEVEDIRPHRMLPPKPRAA